MDTARRTRAGGSAAFRFVADAMSVQLTMLGLTTALWFGLHLTDVKFARDVVLGGVVFTALVLLAVSPVLTAVQRNRLCAMLGVDIPPVTARMPIARTSTSRSSSRSRGSATSVRVMANASSTCAFS